MYSDTSIRITKTESDTSAYIVRSIDQYRPLKNRHKSKKRRLSIKYLKY